MDYIMVFCDDTEKWFYYINTFNENEPQFKNGYVDYYITVSEDGQTIVKDTFSPTNKGKDFVLVYDINLWS